MRATEEIDIYPPYDFRQLYYFVAVAEAGQITRAAAELNIAQPALSQTISRLEASVGLPLLKRHPRGVSLTPAGAAFLEKARDALHAAEEAQAVLGPWLRTSSSVVLGFLPSLQPIARPILRRLMHGHPSIEAQVRHLSPSRRAVELKLGGIDAELLFPPPLDPELVVETVTSSRRFLLLPESHPLAGESGLSFEQIADETFPGRHPSVSERWANEAWLTDRRGHPPRVTSETPLTLDEVWTLVYAGKAVAVLPEFMVPPTVGDGVRGIPLLDVDPIEIGLARRRADRRYSVRALFEAMRQCAAELASGPTADASSAPELLRREGAA